MEKSEECFVLREATLLLGSGGAGIHRNRVYEEKEREVWVENGFGCSKLEEKSALDLNWNRESTAEGLTIGEELALHHESLALFPHFIFYFKFNLKL